MNMAFRVVCVRDHLARLGFVYTVRKSTLKYPEKVTVEGLGLCRATLVAPIDQEEDLSPHMVERSGFGDRDEWWAAIIAFRAVPGNLWLVERIDG